MINLVRSEVLKIRSTQVWFWMLLLAATFTSLGTIGNVVNAVNDYDNGAPVDYYGVFTQSGGAGVALLVLGLLGLTTEFRHKTITPTLLATPNRWQLLAGKAASYAVFAIVYALITPGGAVKAFNSNGHVGGMPGDAHLLAPAAGGLLFLAWSLALLVIGGRISLSRDIS